MAEDGIGVGVEKSCLSDFLDDLKGRMILLSDPSRLPEDEDKDMLIQALKHPSLVIGQPGIGKTAGIISTIKDLNKDLPKEKQWGFKKILLGQTTVGELSGIPVVVPSTGEVVRVQMPDLPVAERDGEYGVLFLDELTTADEAQMQPALGLADDSRSLGTYTLPENWIVVAAGNGPDCSNFVRLDDAMISRFAVYDIQYDYVKDWRPWAHENKINELILAFCNFLTAQGDPIIQVESTESDTCGKAFANPRTWTNLSLALKIRSLSKPVTQGELLKFSSMYIGTPMARKFTAFAAFRDKVQYDPKKILSGEERKPGKIGGEEFHIILQQICKLLQLACKNGKKADGDYEEIVYQSTANAINWITSLKDASSLEQTYNGIAELNSEVRELMPILLSPHFADICPALDQFFNDPDVLMVTRSQKETGTLGNTIGM